MKITIISPEVKKPEVLTENVCGLLNKLVETADFFKVGKTGPTCETIVSGPCANDQLHTKLIGLIILFFSSQKCRSYVGLGYNEHTATINLYKYEPEYKKAFYDFLLGLGENLRNVRISFDN